MKVDSAGEVELFPLDLEAPVVEEDIPEVAVARPMETLQPTVVVEEVHQVDITISPDVGYQLEVHQAEEEVLALVTMMLTEDGFLAPDLAVDTLEGEEEWSWIVTPRPYN